VGAILGIETSCDETAAAVVTEDGQIQSSVLDSQTDVHAPYGGVVPELASRRHIERIEQVVQGALDQASVRIPDLTAIAVTQGPGLAGALLVGVNFAKAMAFASQLPLIPVNHLRGHLASAWMAQPQFPRPAIMLVVSGGHTHLYLTPQAGNYELIGQTRDDAAGEAFDKAARMLGLDYPGGPVIDRLAKKGNPQAIPFPRPYLNRGGLNFSFSGLKTSLLYYLRDVDKIGKGRPPVEDLAASYQEALVEVLVKKALRAVQQYHVKGLAVVGGVAANSRLRDLLKAGTAHAGISLVVPPLSLCTDNAAMIAAAGWEEYKVGRVASWDVDAKANGSLVGLHE
jgi:N6-L-threonylcarbamoyladenine synthase